MIELFSNLSEKNVNICILVLSSAGIRYRTKRDEDGWSIWVHVEDSHDAFSEISGYYEENRAAEIRTTNLYTPFHKTPMGIWAALVLMISHISIVKHGGTAFFAENYGASAYDILHGELFRVVTALMIHSDFVHLMGNMVGFGLFYTAVCSLQGFGTGSLSILAAGALGNYVNAWVYTSSHVSIGASTAVFGAVGILIAHQSFHITKVSGTKFKAWLPLGSGICLLGILSAGEHTDILAHLFGLGAGIAIGCLHETVMKKPAETRFQYLFLLITLVIILISWMRII